MAWVTIANLTGPPGDAATMEILDKTPRIRGAADGMNLNNMTAVSQFGWYEFLTNSGVTGIPSEAVGRCELFIHGATAFSVIQELTVRDTNLTWRRTCPNSGASPKVWTPWRSDLGANGSCNGRDLNEMRTYADFGTWEFDYTSSTLNMPQGLIGKGILTVRGSGVFSVVQTVTSRDQNITWTRTGTNLGTTPLRWSAWSITGAPAESSRVELAMVGDSLVASHNLVPSLTALLPGIYCYSRGWNGETTDGLTLRLGAKDYWWTVSGGTIPATGSVAVTTAQSIHTMTADTYYTGILAGVAGRINKTSAGFAFVRDADGSSVSVSGPLKLDPTWTATTRVHMVGILAGRNDVTNNNSGVDGSVARHIVANTKRIVDYLLPENKLFFLLGTINRTDEPSGSAGYSNVVDANRLLENLYPGQFIDLRRYLVNQVIYDLGITPTAGDLSNMANDCPPPSVMVDDTHYTDEAATKIAENLIVPWLKGNGYVAV